MCPTIAKVTRFVVHRPVVANASRRTADPGADESSGLDALNSLIPTLVSPMSAPVMNRGSISVYLVRPSPIRGIALFLFVIAGFHMSFHVSFHVSFHMSATTTTFLVLLLNLNPLGLPMQTRGKSTARLFVFSFRSWYAHTNDFCSAMRDYEYYHFEQ
jgi:hypothetical protein